MKLKDTCSLEEKLWFFQVVMYGCELDHKEGWVPKNWCFWTVVLEKILESLLDCKKIKPVNPRKSVLNIHWKDNAEAEVPILWSPDAKRWFIGKDPDAEKDWRQEEMGTTEDEMVGWHHWLQWTWVWASSGSWWWTGKPGMLQSMGHKESVRTEWLNLTDTEWLLLLSVPYPTDWLLVILSPQFPAPGSVYSIVCAVLR